MESKKQERNYAFWWITGTVAAATALALGPLFYLGRKTNEHEIVALQTPTPVVQPLDRTPLSLVDELDARYIHGLEALAKSAMTDPDAKLRERGQQLQQSLQDFRNHTGYYDPNYGKH